MILNSNVSISFHDSMWIENSDKVLPLVTVPKHNASELINNLAYIFYIYIS